MIHEIGRQCGDSITLIFRPTIFDQEVFAFDKTRLVRPPN